MPAVTPSLESGDVPADDDDFEVPSYRVVDLDLTAFAKSIRNSATDDPRTVAEQAGVPCSEFMTKAEVAERLKVNPRTVERAINDGKLPAYKLLSRVRICRDELEDWIQAQRVPPSVHDI
jgi:excisionase family DNA binding protein